MKIDNQKPNVIFISLPTGCGILAYYGVEVPNEQKDANGVYLYADGRQEWV